MCEHFGNIYQSVSFAAVPSGLSLATIARVGSPARNAPATAYVFNPRSVRLILRELRG